MHLVLMFQQISQPAERYLLDSCYLTTITKYILILSVFVFVCVSVCGTLQWEFIRHTEVFAKTTLLQFSLWFYSERTLVHIYSFAIWELTVDFMVLQMPTETK